MGAGSALLGVTLCTWQGTGQPGARVLGAEQGAGGRSCWLPTAAPRVLPWVAQHWHCPPLPMGSCLVPTPLAPCNGSGTVPITAAASPSLAIAFSPCRQTGTVPLQPSPSRGDCPTPRPFAQFCPCGQLQSVLGAALPGACSRPRHETQAVPRAGTCCVSCSGSLPQCSGTQGGSPAHGGFCPLPWHVCMCVCQRCHAAAAASAAQPGSGWHWGHTQPPRHQ